jgi:hypothetical protein
MSLALKSIVRADPTSPKIRARTSLCFSLPVSKAKSTIRQHCPRQCPHIRVHRSQSPYKLLTCLRLSEPAPHHSTEKHVVVVHLRFPLSSHILPSVAFSPTTSEIIQIVRVQSCCQPQVFSPAAARPLPRWQDDMEHAQLS